MRRPMRAHGHQGGALPRGAADAHTSARPLTLSQGDKSLGVSPLWGRDQCIAGRLWETSTPMFSWRGAALLAQRSGQ